MEKNKTNLKAHVRMWKLDYKKSWAQKNWCFWIMVLEKSLESPLDSKEIQPVHPKGNQSWIFFGRTDVEAETPILCHQMRRTDSFEKTLMLGKIEGGRRRGWDGWVASPTQWTWVWVNSGSWWWTGKPGVLQSKGSQRVGHDWTTELKKFMNQGMDRQNGVYSCNGILLSNRKEWAILRATTWTNFKHMSSERGQKQKTAYCTIPFTWNVQKR